MEVDCEDSLCAAHGVLSLEEKVSDISGTERSQVQLSWGGERGTEEREILREMSDLGDIDHAKEEEEEEALPVFFPRVINTASRLFLLLTSSCKAPAPSEARAVMAFFFYI